MSVFQINIPGNFDWDSEEGQYLNLMLNIAGGLSEEHLSEDEKELILRMERKYGANDNVRDT